MTTLDREKVMQWLETCISGCKEECPYEYENLVSREECKADLMRDALALLQQMITPRTLTMEDVKKITPPRIPTKLEPASRRKEQEPVRPKLRMSKYGFRQWLVCGSCLEKLPAGEDYCPCCNRKVKWND